MHADIGELTFKELVEELADIQTTRTPAGWPTENAVNKASVERRIMEFVCAPRRVREDDVECKLPIRVEGEGGAEVAGTVRSVGIGGVHVFVGKQFEIGQPVELEIRTQNEYGLKARGNVALLTKDAEGKPHSISISFAQVAGDAAERRVRRLVFELLRHVN